MRAKLFFALVLGLLALPDAVGQGGDAKKTTSETRDELTLEKLFPKKGHFGPSASGMAFSHDGRYAAYLYRSYADRLQGNDLWLLDTTDGKTTRVTSAKMLAHFQASARKALEGGKKGGPAKGKDNDKKTEVSDEHKASFRELDTNKDGKLSKDELLKAAERAGGKAEFATRMLGKMFDSLDTDSDGFLSLEEFGQARMLSFLQARGSGDEKGKDEQKDKKGGETPPANRYSGVSAFTWSPVAHELLFISEGDVYRWKVGDKMPDRLTRVRGATSTEDVRAAIRKGGPVSFGLAAQYLHDGSGYTYLRKGELMRVVFGSHLVEMLTPRLSPSETMTSYKLSPDGKRMVLVTRKGDGKGDPKSDKKVNIASYRDRFMKVQEVPRQVSDDVFTPVEHGIYLYELGERMIEDGLPTQIFTYKTTGPRDVLSPPDWSPDGKKVTFAYFAQSTSQVQVMVAQVPADPKKKAESARVVYRYLHTGGPNTPRMLAPRFAHDGRNIALMTEQSGFRHLYLLDPVYETMDQVTFGRYEVYPVAMSKDRKSYFVAATKEMPACQDLYKVDLAERTMTRMTKECGVYDRAAVSPDGKHALAIFEKYGAGQELVYINGEGSEKALTDSHPAGTKKLISARPEFFTYKNRHGHDIHGYLFKPADWSKSDKRPLVIYVYGGPLGTRKQVTEGAYDSNGYFFARYLAEKHGFIACTIDPRGMSGYGGLFERSSFKQVGKPQTEDLVDGVKYLVANCGVDAKRVGIHGWSFGGFQTQHCMYTEPNVFAAGIAGAGPTEWENYNMWYSTGTIGETRTGQPDLGKYSLLPLAKNLKGKLLLVHGMEDSNVLYQDTVRVYRELLKAGKETNVELLLDPTGGHGLGGDITPLAKYRKYEEFFVRHLGRGQRMTSGPAVSEAPKK